ncbi:MAG: putative sporulation protein [Actinomycetia bacterium]|nr:putative sporulation protein [Actinomycetes bacterium]
MRAVDLLTQPVSRFVGTVAPALGELAERARPTAGRVVSVDAFRRDAAAEAQSLVAAIMSADDRYSDAELTAYVVAFAPWFESLAHADLQRLRDGDVLRAQRGWIDAASPMFGLLVDADRRYGTSHAWDYYDAATRVAHAVCAIDDLPGREELLALDRFRAALLERLDDARIARPGDPTRSAVVVTNGPAADAMAAPATAGSAPMPIAVEAPPTLDALLAQLDALIGLEAVKTEVRLMTNLIRVQNLRRDRGLPVVEQSHHRVFVGNPGTGKTTVARLLAQIYRALGVLPVGQLVETDRSGLVAPYIGQTAAKVHAAVDAARGGMLFVDEAYALVNGSDQDFGHEAVSTLLKAMEDHRDDLAVVFAGYPAPMAALLDSNPGLRSRFPKTIEFADYTDVELVEIFAALCAEHHYRLSPSGRAAALGAFAAESRGPSFGNARLARNRFESAVTRQATRVVELPDPTDDELTTLEPADIRPEATGPPTRA